MKLFLSKNKRLIFAISFHAILTVWILAYFISRKVTVPFVDDWLLVPWGTGQASYDWSHFIEHLNGHQHNLVKLYSWFLGYFLHFNLFTSALIGTCIGSVGYFLLIWSQLRRLQLTKFQFLFSFMGLSLAVLSWRQMQNFFMIICFPWMMSVLAIGIFYWIRYNYDGLQARLLTYLIITLAPMTNALGLVVPIAFFIESFFICFKYRQIKGEQVLNMFLAFLSICFSFIYPVLSHGQALKNNYDSAFSIIELIQRQFVPAVKFLFAAMGQPFVMWSPVSVGSAAILGILSTLLLFGVIYSDKTGKRWEDFIMNKTSSMVGLVYVLLFFLARFKGLGPEGSIEPRYTTASLVFLVGVAISILYPEKTRNYVVALIFLCGIYLHWKGTPIGRGYYETRYAQTVTIEKCFQEKVKMEGVDFLNKDLDLEDPCMQKLNPGDWLNSNDYLHWANGLRKNHQAFFQKLK